MSDIQFFIYNTLEEKVMYSKSAFFVLNNCKLFCVFQLIYLIISLNLTNLVVLKQNYHFFVLNSTVLY